MTIAPRPRPANLPPGVNHCGWCGAVWQKSFSHTCEKWTELPTGKAVGKEKPKARPAPGRETERAMESALIAEGFRLGEDFVREYSWAVDQGRGYRADFGFLRIRLLVECEGGAHRVKRQHLIDCQRASLAAALGYLVVRIHRAMVDSGEAVALVKQALSHGRAA